MFAGGWLSPALGRRLGLETIAIMGICLMTTVLLTMGYTSNHLVFIADGLARGYLGTVNALIALQQAAERVSRLCRCSGAEDPSLGKLCGGYVSDYDQIHRVWYSAVAMSTVPDISFFFIRVDEGSISQSNSAPFLRGCTDVQGCEDRC